MIPRGPTSHRVPENRGPLRSWSVWRQPVEPAPQDRNSPRAARQGSSGQGHRALLRTGMPATRDSRMTVTVPGRSTDWPHVVTSDRPHSSRPEGPWAACRLSAAGGPARHLLFYLFLPHVDRHLRGESFPPQPNRIAARDTAPLTAPSCMTPTRPSAAASAIRPPSEAPT